MAKSDDVFQMAPMTEVGSTIGTMVNMNQALWGLRYAQGAYKGVPESGNFVTLLGLGSDKYVDRAINSHLVMSGLQHTAAAFAARNLHVAYGGEKIPGDFFDRVFDFETEVKDEIPDDIKEFDLIEETEETKKKNTFIRKLKNSWEITRRFATGGLLAALSSIVQMKAVSWGSKKITGVVRISILGLKDDTAGMTDSLQSIAGMFEGDVEQIVDNAEAVGEAANAFIGLFGGADEQERVRTMEILRRSDPLFCPRPPKRNDKDYNTNRRKFEYHRSYMQSLGLKVKAAMIPSDPFVGRKKVPPKEMKKIHNLQCMKKVVRDLTVGTRYFLLESEAASLDQLQPIRNEAVTIVYGEPDKNGKRPELYLRYSPNDDTIKFYQRGIFRNFRWVNAEQIGEYAHGMVINEDKKSDKLGFRAERNKKLIRKNNYDKAIISTHALSLTMDSYISMLNKRQHSVAGELVKLFITRPLNTLLRALRMVTYGYISAKVKYPQRRLSSVLDKSLVSRFKKRLLGKKLKLPDVYKKYYGTGCVISELPTITIDDKDSTWTVVLKGSALPMDRVWIQKEVDDDVVVDRVAVEGDTQLKYRDVGKRNEKLYRLSVFALDPRNVDIEPLVSKEQQFERKEQKPLKKPAPQTNTEEKTKYTDALSSAYYGETSGSTTPAPPTNTEAKPDVHPGIKALSNEKYSDAESVTTGNPDIDAVPITDQTDTTEPPVVTPDSAADRTDDNIQSDVAPINNIQSDDYGDTSDEVLFLDSADNAVTETSTTDSRQIPTPPPLLPRIPAEPKITPIQPQKNYRTQPDAAKYAKTDRDGQSAAAEPETGIAESEAKSAAAESAKKNSDIDYYISTKTPDKIKLRPLGNSAEESNRALRQQNQGLPRVPRVGDILSAQNTLPAGNVKPVLERSVPWPEKNLQPLPYKSKMMPSPPEVPKPVNLRGLPKQKAFPENPLNELEKPVLPPRGNLYKNTNTQKKELGPLKPTGPPKPTRVSTYTRPIGYTFKPRNLGALKQPTELKDENVTDIIEQQQQYLHDMKVQDELRKTVGDLEEERRQLMKKSLRNQRDGRLRLSKLENKGGEAFNFNPVHTALLLCVTLLASAAPR